MNTDNNTATAGGSRLSCNSEIAIRVKNGTAIISGFACSSDEKTQAEAAVHSMLGVSTVFNLIKTSAD